MPTPHTVPPRPHLLPLRASAAAAATNTGTVTIRLDQCKQVMEGLGYSNAFYTAYWDNHPNQQDLYHLLFDQLQPSIIRLRNAYGLTDQSNNEMQRDVRFIAAASQKLGYTPFILLTSWTPQASIKVSGTLTGDARDANGNMTSTLAKDTNGYLQYYGFDQHWTDSLVAYAKLGIQPDFISPQNEPDYVGGAECCFFAEQESSTYAGYYRAATEVYDKIQADTRITKKPKMVGPECTGMDKYLTKFPVGGGNYFHAIAGHLYGNGGISVSNPWVFSYGLSNASNIASNLNVSKVWMTEFAQLTAFQHEDPLNHAIVIHNALTVGNVTAYLHWDAAWAADAGTGEGTMILVDNPNKDPSSWSNPAGYSVLMNFWWYKHFTNNIRPGYQRVQCDVSAQNVLASAWTGPNGLFSIILINHDSQNSAQITLQNLPQWWSKQVNDVYSSTLDKAYSYLGSLPGNSITLQPQSIVSIFSYSKPVGS